MRSARGLLDAFGAGVPLVALLACAVLGVTVAVGERGWPGAAGAPSFERLGRVAAGAPGATGPPVPGQPAAVVPMLRLAPAPPRARGTLHRHAAAHSHRAGTAPRP